MFSCRGQDLGEVEQFTITKPRIIGEKITEFLEYKREKLQLAAYREMERKQTEYNFKQEMDEAILDFEVTRAKILGIDPKKSKRRL